MASMEAGPSRPEQQTQTSRRPVELSTSSMRESVSCSLEKFSGYGIMRVLGYSSLMLGVCGVKSSVWRREQAGGDVSGRVEGEEGQGRGRDRRCRPRRELGIG